MKRLLVHLHLYYADQTDYFLDRLSHIHGCRWTLIVTMPEYDADICCKFKTCCSDVRIMTVENRGYDIWPFIKVIQSVNLDDWDYILKLHTKNFQRRDKVNGLVYSGYRWRDSLVDAILGDDDRFSHALRLLERPDTGLVCERLFYRNVSAGLPEDLSMLEEELNRLCIVSGDRHFCAGSIFMAKCAPYMLLQDGRVNASVFGTAVSSHSVGTMAHVYERIISIVVTSFGLKIRPIVTMPLKSLYVTVMVDALQPLMEKAFSIRRIGDERRKVLTILGMNIPLR